MNGIHYQITSSMQDLEVVKSVTVEAFAASGDANIEAWFSFEEMQRNINMGRGLCIQAIDASSFCCGCIYAQAESPINNREGLEKWVINLMAVSPEKAGQGIGSGLIAELESAVRKLGVIKMFVFANESDLGVQQFYQKNGYVSAGRIQDYQYGDNNSAVFLLKYL